MIGNNISHFRQLRGYSQTELANSIGHSSPAYISFIEKGKRNISANDLLKISQVLGVPIERFYENLLVEDTKIVKLKAGQTIHIGGVPIEILGDCKVAIHANSYSLIEKFLL